MKKIVVLGAGITGVSVGYHAKQKDYNCQIFESKDAYGGLCGNFTISGFRFDYAVHLSFTKNEYVRSIFDKTDYYTHQPEAYNYSKGYWLKHPLQNNLHPLSVEEKIAIIKGFMNRSMQNAEKNYKEWLINQYGNYFAEKYPIIYTKKYWTIDAEELSTSWIGNRMYKPSIDEILFGAMTDETPNTYYAKEMRYPKQGGYLTFIEGMAKKCNINLKKKATYIHPREKYVEFQDGSKTYYDKLVSTIPLPELIKIIDNVPCGIERAVNDLVATSIALVSVGFKRIDIPKNLWFYIYDEDIKVSRVYSPSLKSPNNVPEGSSSLQFEIYYSKYKSLDMNKEQLIEHVIWSIEKMKLANKSDIQVVDCRCIPYANVIFNHGMIAKREYVKQYLESIGIYIAGRFGEWDYLWSDQSLLSGKNIVESL